MQEFKWLHDDMVAVAFTYRQRGYFCSSVLFCYGSAVVCPSLHAPGLTMARVLMMVEVICFLQSLATANMLLFDHIFMLNSFVC